jgi:hypothetical protein
MWQPNWRPHVSISTMEALDVLSLWPAEPLHDLSLWTEVACKQTHVVRVELCRAQCLLAQSLTQILRDSHWQPNWRLTCGSVSVPRGA